LKLRFRARDQQLRRSSHGSVFPLKRDHRHRLVRSRREMAGVFPYAQLSASGPFPANGKQGPTLVGRALRQPPASSPHEGAGAPQGSEEPSSYFFCSASPSVTPGRVLVQGTGDGRQSASPPVQGYLRQRLPCNFHRVELPLGVLRLPRNPGDSVRESPVRVAGWPKFAEAVALLCKWAEQNGRYLHSLRMPSASHVRTSSSVWTRCRCCQ